MQKQEEYNVQADYGYGHGYETVCCEATRKEAQQRLREYLENERTGSYRIRRRVFEVYDANDKGMPHTRVYSNRNWREPIQSWQLTQKERNNLDWVDWDDCGSDFIRYRGCIYHLSQFIRSHGPGDWQGMHADSFFSGIVIRFSDDGETYQIGTLFSHS